MTAYVTFEALREGKIKLDTKIGCSEARQPAATKQGSACRLAREMTVETALQVLIVKSANDVAIMLAEAVGGTQEAFRGAHECHGRPPRHDAPPSFVNANGLPAPDQVTTARRPLPSSPRPAIRDLPGARGALVDG